MCVVFLRERTLDLKFNLDGSLQQGLSWCTASDQSCGQIEAGESIDLALSLMAIAPGLQVILYSEWIPSCIWVFPIVHP